MAEHKAVEVGLRLGGEELGTPNEATGNIIFGLGDSLPFLTKRVEGQLRTEMRPGLHALQFGERAIRIRIPKQAPCEIKAVFEGEQNKISLSHLKIVFNSPIVVENLFTTIDEVQMLFAESPVDPFFFMTKASAYLDKFSGVKGIKRLTQKVLKGGLSDSLLRSREVIGRGVERAEEAMDNIVKVSLSALECRAYEHLEGRFLHIYFTGEVIFSEKLRIPFKLLRVPERLIPRFFADVSKLVEQFCVDSSRGESLMLTFASMIESIEGQVSAKLQVNGIDFRFITREERHLEVSLAKEYALSIDAKMDAGRVGEELAFLLEGSIEDGDDFSIKSRFAFSLREAQLLGVANLINPEKAWRFSLMGSGNDLEGRWEILRGSYIKDFSLAAEASEGRSYVGFEGELGVEKIELSSVVDFGLAFEECVVYTHAFSVNSHGKLAFVPGMQLNAVDLVASFSTLRGPFTLACVRKINGDISASLKVDAELLTNILIRTQVFPEFGLNEPQLRLKLQGKAQGELLAYIRENEKHEMEISFDQSQVLVEMAKSCVEWCKAALTLDDSAKIVLSAKNFSLSSRGIRSSDFALSWDFLAPPMLCANNRNAPILAKELQRGGFDFHISKAGLVRISGGSGFYDGHFFNALINPDEELHKYVQILSSDSFGQSIVPALRVVSDKAADFAELCIKKINILKRFAKEEGYTAIKDFLPTLTLGRAISQVLVESDALAQEMHKVVTDVIEAKGVDRPRIMRIIEDYFPDYEYLYEIDRILRWLNNVASPVKFVPPAQTREIAISEQKAYQSFCAPLPSAAEFYALKENNSAAENVLDYGSGFSLAQLEWLESQNISMTPTAEKRLLTLLKIKKRLADQEPRGGGYLFQDFSIDLFLGSLLKQENAALAQLKHEEQHGFEAMFRSLLSPEDIAILLSAGISSKYHGQLVQINQDRLFELIQRRGRDYAIAVFYEVGQGNSRILNSMLLSFLEQTQLHLRESVDRSKALSQLFNYDVPRRADFMAGGLRAKDSYYAAINELSEFILSQSKTYEAAKKKMQDYRHPSDKSQTTNSKEAKKAANALKKADKLALAHDFDAPEQDPKKLEKLKSAYLAAYSAAAQLLQSDPKAFKLPWFQEFWSRTHEMLLIRSFLRNIKEEIEECVAWTERKFGKTLPDSQNELVKLAVDILYHYQEDKERILSDPLVRLQIAPAKGKVALSIVSSMGVITDGEDGYELECSYKRLQEERGVKLVRANTGTIKTLDYNARIISEAIMSVEGPFAMLGYSQGCANMLEAERRLYQGTPESRLKLDNLVSRQFIFSSLNGSAHASCGNEKYLRAVVEGESILKFYQAIYSKATIQSAFTLLKSLMESRYGTHFLGSVTSLSHEGLQALARDGQFSPDVPSLSTRAVLSQDIPECLVFMRNHYIKQTQDPQNDSQVADHCAYGYFIWNSNDDVDELKHSDIPTRTLEAHHWSTLLRDVEFIETQYDRERLVYRGPKDLFLFPWIEGLILFGKLPLIEDEVS
ncbi:MAG: hypothetical protein WC966_06380 [Bradymonadales bacterium]